MFQSQCPTEYSYNHEYNVNVTWQSKKPDEIVTTLCLYKNNTLIKRSCKNSKWIPETTPQCHKLQKVFIPECDEGDREEGDFCIYYNPSTPKTTFPFNKPVENINDTLRIANLFENITEMWLPVLRREKYDKFVWVKPYVKEKNKIYWHPLLTESNKNQNTYNCDCMAATNITVDKKSENEYDVKYVPKIVNCTNNFPTVYVYKKVAKYFVSNNKIEKYGRPLFYSTTGNKAFYIDKKCKEIAEPRHKEDNFLIKHLVQNRSCGIGIEYSKNIRNFVWKSTNKVINYTDWISSTQFNFDKVVISENGWSLNSSKFVQCYVCEIDRNNYVTDLILKTKNDNLILIAYSYNILFYSIVCQVDGLEDFQYEFDFKSIQVHNEIKNEITTFNNRSVWKLLVHSKKPIELNQFYCSGSLFPYGDDNRITKRVFFGRNINSEFAFRVTFRHHCIHHVCDPYLNRNFIKSLPEIPIKKPIIKNIRAMQILNINEMNGDIELLYHAQIERKINIKSGYDQLKDELKKINNDSFIIHLNSLKSSQGCLPNDIVVNNVSLHWDFTEIGAIAINDKCMQSNYVPISRTCSGTFRFGGTWKNVSDSCNKKIPDTIVTKQLRNLRSEINSMSITNISNTLANLTRESSRFQPIDIIYIKDFIKDITLNLNEMDNPKQIAKNMSAVISNLVATNNATLKSLSKFNTTNEILTSIETLMENIAIRNLDKQGVFQQVESNFMCHFFDPLSNNITGIALIRPKTTNVNPPFTDYKTELLTADSKTEELIEMDNLEMAAFIPRLLFDQIIKETKNVSIKINIMIYYNESLFVESKPRNESKVSTKIFSISILGFDKTLYSPVPVIFRNFHPEQTNTSCAFWGFEISGGTWNIDVPSKKKYLTEKNMQICAFDHLTNFALLLGMNLTYNSIFEANTMISDNVLFYMTGAGSILSIFGIFVIFLTAVVFKIWRKQAGTKIILNVSMCLFMEILFLYGNGKINTTACVVTGTLLHYFVLSGFMWSLVMAYLQYWRFVKVLGNSTSHLILKAVTIGWIVPIIPIAIVHIIYYNDASVAYMPKHTNLICYPQANVLYTTVYLPVGTIVLINITVFCMIIYNIHTQTKAMSTFRCNYNQREIMIKEIKLGIFLFFSLSLPWIFGFMTISQICDKCVYLFVLTASSQGFMLFVYCILSNKDVMLSWMKLIKIDRKGFSSSGVSASKTNLTNEENQMDNMKRKKSEHTNQKLQEFNNFEGKNMKTDNSDKKYINPENQDELRKRVKIIKENKNNTDEKPNSPKRNFNDYVAESEKLQTVEGELHNYDPIKKDIGNSDILKSEVTSEVAVDEEATSKKKYNPERVGGIQQKMVMQDLMKQQENINSPFSK